MIDVGENKVLKAITVVMVFSLMLGLSGFDNDSIFIPCIMVFVPLIWFSVFTFEEV